MYALFCLETSYNPGDTKSIHPWSVAVQQWFHSVFFVCTLYEQITLMHLSWTSQGKTKNNGGKLKGWTPCCSFAKHLGNGGLFILNLKQTVFRKWAVAEFFKPLTGWENILSSLRFQPNIRIKTEIEHLNCNCTGAIYLQSSSCE